LTRPLNAVLAQVEPVLAMPNAIAGKKVMTLESVDEPQAEQGEKPIAVAVMHYAVTYQIEEDAPETAL
jgi:hypothetical protein